MGSAQAMCLLTDGYKPRSKYLHPPRIRPASAMWGTQTWGNGCCTAAFSEHWDVQCDSLQETLLWLKRFLKLFVSQPSFGLFAWETHCCFEKRLNELYLFIRSLRESLGSFCTEPTGTCPVTESTSKHKSKNCTAGVTLVEPCWLWWNKWTRH